MSDFHEEEVLTVHHWTDRLFSLPKPITLAWPVPACPG
jgi:hypothetical protein